MAENNKRNPAEPGTVTATREVGSVYDLTAPVADVRRRTESDIAAVARSGMEPRDWSYSQMWEAISAKPENKEEREARHRRQKRQRLFASLRDGMGAVANLWATTGSVPAASLQPEYGATKAEHDSLDSRIAAKSKEWYNGMVHAIELDRQMKQLKEQKEQTRREWTYKEALYKQEIEQARLKGDYLRAQTLTERYKAEEAKVKAEMEKSVKESLMQLREKQGTAALIRAANTGRGGGRTGSGMGEYTLEEVEEYTYDPIGRKTGKTTHKSRRKGASSEVKKQSPGDTNKKPSPGDLSSNR